MKDIIIRLDTVDKIREFSETISKFDADMDLISGNSRYVIDAKSIMGIFSLDLSNNLRLRIHSDDTLVIEKSLVKFMTGEAA